MTLVPPTPKLRVLFVDDTEQVLQALRHVLHSMRGSWEMSFVGSGAEALAQMEARPFDVIVSDMRMPKMSGEELLQRTRALYPSIARILLSGQADPEAMARAQAHQFLGKPCDTEVLKAAINRAATARFRLEDNGLRTLVGKLDRLPSLPASYLRLTEAIELREASAASIARVVEQDPAMCARLLQIVNSPYYGHGRAIATIEAAVVQLGLQQLRALALSAHVFALLAESGDAPLLLRMQLDAMATSRIARRLIPDRKLGDEAFTAALVHDVGQMLLMRAFPEKYPWVLREAHTSGRPFLELEREHVGTTHAQVGGYLLGTWGLPAAIVDSAALHQEPRLFVSGSPLVVAAIHAASAFVEAHLEGLPIEETRLDEEFLASAGADVPRWIKIAAEELAAFALPQTLAG